MDKAIEIIKKNIEHKKAMRDHWAEQIATAEKEGNTKRAKQCKQYLADDIKEGLTLVVLLNEIQKA